MFRRWLYDNPFMGLWKWYSNRDPWWSWYSKISDWYWDFVDTALGFAAANEPVALVCADPAVVCTRKG